MKDAKYFFDQLKRAQLRRQNNQTNQETKVTTKVTTMVGTIKLTDEQYKNIIVAKAVTCIRGRA